MSEPGVILVTGSTGNVGRSLVSQLLEVGAEVRALTRDPGSARLPDGANAVVGDLSHLDQVIDRLGIRHSRRLSGSASAAAAL